jgi:hypothetical protein
VPCITDPALPHVNGPRRKVEAVDPLDTTANEPAFDHFVAAEREDPVVDEDRPGVPVPVDARRSTL